jgi:O-antigen/teichoic acid export membrane protein
VSDTAASRSRSWDKDGGHFFTFARNVGTCYAAIAINALIGLMVLPFNVHHLGRSAYGLWMLTYSVTTYFTVLDLGYGGAVVRFVAAYRAKKDARALNEILSTMYFLYAGIGILSYLVAIAVSFLLPHIFNLAPDQVSTGRTVLLITSLNVAVAFAFAVYGGVINGFQSYYLNNVVGTASEILVAIVNVIVLSLGYGLVELVAATTVLRMMPYALYRYNAHRVFPDLDIRWRHFRRDRLKELTGFSVYLAIINWSARLNYAVDTVIIGIFLNTAAIGTYSVGLRLSQALFRITNQLHLFLFPAVVHREVTGNAAEQQRLMVRATRFQLAIATASCGAVIAAADVLIRVWIGPGFEQSVLILQLLAYVVVLRAWMAMPSTVLKGTNRHKFVARASVVCAVANVLLSIVFVKMFGLVGVALGTVIPVSVLAWAVIFPTTCHAVGLSTWEGYRQVVWPAVWPAFIVMATLVVTRHMVPLRLTAVFGHLLVGGLEYIVIFLVLGLDREERQWFWMKFNEVWRRLSRVSGELQPARS